MSDQDWDRLPCGRNKADLLGLIADESALGSHEASCPYCQAAAAELAMLWAPLKDWGRRPLEVPRNLVRTIMARVRRMAQSPRHVVAHAASGMTTLTSWVIALLSAEAAQHVPGVAAVGPSMQAPSGLNAKLRREADAVEVTEVGGAAVSVELAITAHVGHNLGELSGAVRRAVISEIHRSADLEVDEVNLVISDITEI